VYRTDIRRAIVVCYTRLVKSAEFWRWGSLWVRQNRQGALCGAMKPWPVERPRNWRSAVNRDLEEGDLSRLQQSVARGTPLGTAAWQAKTAARLGLEGTTRPRGRPRKTAKKSS